MQNSNANEPQSILEAQPINLEQFERLVYARRYDDAILQLLNIFISIKRAAPFSWYGTCPSIETLFTRLASAIGSMFADPQFVIPYEGFVRIMADHATLHSIFRASNHRSMDYVLHLIGDRDPENPHNLRFGGDHVVPKLLVCWSLDSEVNVDFEMMGAQIPDWIAVSLVALLGVGGIHYEKAYRRKIELSRLAWLIGKAPLHEPMLLSVGDVYMHCSYTDEPDKHEVKKILNAQLRSMVETKMGAPVHEAERGSGGWKERPTVVVPLEWFGTHHAMFRCYAPSIRQLRKRFRVVGIARPFEIDGAAKAEFDKFVTLDDASVSLDKMIKTITDENPDIVYYPSLGMASWWVALSNFRLAPIQVMSPGHPASSHSGCIDYIVSDGDLFGDTEHYSETCIPMPVGGARYIARADLDVSKLPGRPDDGVIRIAIPAMVMKLTPPFLSAVQKIVQGTSRKVEVHFFPNQIATSYEIITRDLKTWIPDCIIHQRMEYMDYLKQLSRCDLMLSTFPFGGTNSTIDALLCGVPVLTLEGDQIHSRSDASMIRRVGLPPILINDNVTSYIASALMLIENEKELKGMQEYLSHADVHGEFYGNGPAEVQDAFLKAFETIYDREVKNGRSEAPSVLAIAG